jgi:hypothetical protein
MGAKEGSTSICGPFVFFLFFMSRISPTAPALSELLPEGGFAAGEERVFAGIPAKEMRGFSVKAMMFAGGPDFVEQEGARDFEGAVQVVGEASFFAAGGGDQGAEFRFEQTFLTFLGSEDDSQGYGVFGELGG